MKVACVHYHLRDGGVTRVIENALASLAGFGVDVLTLSGEAYGGSRIESTQVVPGLNYLDEPSPDGGAGLGARIWKAATDFFGQAPDVWHIHNHSLGKNADFLGALQWIANKGARILLQIHDFAEDGRPGNYALIRRSRTVSSDHSPPLYPTAPQIHYATLNARDHHILRQASMPTEQLHLLPNPVSAHGLDDAPPIELPEVEKLILYPTRAIRRKNLGELLLHAACAEPGTHFATTLIPKNPQWLEIHRHWETLAKELKLPVRFGLGAEYSFEGLMQRADALITTSVAEGFGLAFLEPFLLHKPLCGRNIDEITTDFSAKDISLDNLYSTLPVPEKLIDLSALTSAIEKSLQHIYFSYQIPIPRDATKRALQSMRAENFIDFGRLNEPFQSEVIRKAPWSPQLKEKVTESLQPTDPERIESNASAVVKNFGLPAYGTQLLAIYQKLTTAPQETIERVDAESVLELFLSPERLNLLRTS